MNIAGQTGTPAGTAAAIATSFIGTGATLDVAVTGIGAITPIGGVAFIAGWLCLAWVALPKWLPAAVSKGLEKF